MDRNYYAQDVIDLSLIPGIKEEIMDLLKDMPSDSWDGHSMIVPPIYYIWHAAALSGYPEMLRELIRIAKPNVKSLRTTIYGCISVVQKACEGGSLECVRILEEAGFIEPWHLWNGGMFSAFGLAVGGGYDDIVLYFLEKGWTTLQQCLRGPIMDSYESRSYRIMETVLKKYKPNLNEFDENGRLLLHDAVLFCHLEFVELLLKYGADLEKPNSKGETPLMVVWNILQPEKLPFENKFRPDSDTCFLNLVDWLLHKGANLFTTNQKNGDTLVHVAGTPGRLKFLSEHGLDVRARNKQGETGLFKCFRSGDKDLLEAYLKYDVPAFDFDSEGNLPFFRAMIEHEDLNTTFALVKAAAHEGLFRGDAYYRSFLEPIPFLSKAAPRRRKARGNARTLLRKPPVSCPQSLYNEHAVAVLETFGQEFLMERQNSRERPLSCATFDEFQARLKKKRDEPVRRATFQEFQQFLKKKFESGEGRLLPHSFKYQIMFRGSTAVDHSVASKPEDEVTPRDHLTGASTDTKVATRGGWKEAFVVFVFLYLEFVKAVVPWC